MRAVLGNLLIRYLLADHMIFDFLPRVLLDTNNMS